MAPAGSGTPPNGPARPCEHVDQIRPVTPRSSGCEACLDLGQRWTGLRLCLWCGWVACSDESPQRHAEAHYRETDHPVVTDATTDSAWRWCYVHLRAV